jgi:hypothetical protein
VYLAHPRLNFCLKRPRTGSGDHVAANKCLGQHGSGESRSAVGLRLPEWASDSSGYCRACEHRPSAGEKGILLYLSFEHPWERLLER